MDIHPLAADITLDAFVQADLNHCDLPDASAFDYFVILDVIEHLHSPEAFVERLRAAASFNPNLIFIFSTGNVAFFVQRLMLLLGQFNYGSRGILDRTHSRLFTFSSLRNLLLQAGFNVLEEKGIPAPFPLVVENRVLSNALLKLNIALNWLSQSVFAYQIFIMAKPSPSLSYLLRSAAEKANAKVFAIDAIQRGVDHPRQQE